METPNNIDNSTCNMVKCEICGLEMKDKINTSHLTRKHNITFQEYKTKFPNANLGKWNITPETFECKLCGKVIKTSSSLSRHLNFEHNMSLEEYYIKFYLNNITPLCKCGCGEKVTFKNMKEGFHEYIHNHATPFVENNEYYKNVKNHISWNKGLTKDTDSRIKQISDSCKASLTPEIIQKRVEKGKETVREKYGVDNVFQLEEVKEKIKETNLALYGVDNPNKSPIIQQKTKQTKLEKYGDANYNNMEKNKQTMLKKYGVEYAAQSVELQQKNQNSGYKFKPYTFPSGKIVNVQGYEPFALDYLLKIYKEEEILTNREDMPELWYKLSDSSDHRYYPDIFIKSQNLIIETKSTWTDSLNIEIIAAKKQCVIDNGYKFQKLIFNNKGELLNHE